MKEVINSNICERADDLIAFLYGELSEIESRRFERHLRECAACEAELGSFGQIRESIIAWRDESLGAAQFPALASIAIPARVPRKPSALAALREFLNLSPLWLKGAAAFASLLFCVCAALAVLYLRGHEPQVVKIDKGKVYSESEFKSAVDIEIKRIAALKEQQQQEVATVPRKKSPAVPSKTPGASTVAVNARRPWTRQERQELAADLRLVSSKDDDDLDLGEASRP